MSQSIFLGANDAGEAQTLLLNRANRHGLVAGATGTGKTVTLQILAEALSEAGVPVFAADVKGDLSGISCPGSEDHKLHDKLLKRAKKIRLENYAYSAPPVVFWDVLQKNGHPIRATISEMGPVLISRLLDLSEAQEGVLNIVFQVADDEDWPLLDLKDLRAILHHVGQLREELGIQYGLISSQSVGAVQRKLLILERQGAEKFFGEPALILEDFLRTDANGHGHVNLLAADQLIHSPRLYSTFLLWLLSELFENLPEVGDPDKPKMVFFFDEAHLLFENAPKALISKIEQVVRLIRSKGVGVFFVTQHPGDLPESVLSQIGTRIEHALRAYTAKERKYVKAAAQSFRANPAFDTEQVITELGVGEALISTLDAKGVPTMVERTLIRPPNSRIGQASDGERQTIMSNSPVGNTYDASEDRRSAYEILQGKMKTAKQKTKKASKSSARSKPARRKRSRQGVGETAVKSAARTIGREIGRSITGPTGRAILRGVLGGIMRR